MKQVRVIEIIEAKFQNKVEQFVNKMIGDFLSQLEQETKSVKKTHTKGYFTDNKDELITRARIDFTPLLEAQATIAGQEALKLINSKDIYLPDRFRKDIVKNVERFATSLIETDQQKLIDIISEGIKEGKSNLDISKQIKSDFDEYSKTQADRITRTEVARVSNQASIDAWEQSGVVEGKQWVTFGAVDECQNYDGEVVSLGKNFYSDTDEFKDGDPPLHPNCKCGTVPIVIKD
jgi:SPP1 gp7 family putative phage head morphogenesis protein